MGRPFGQRWWMSGDPVLALLVGIDAKLDAYFERAAESLATPQVGLAERMERLEPRLMAIRADIGLNVDGVSAVLNREIATRQEVEAMSSRLQALARQVHCLRNDVEELKKRPA